jgi:hypothetical protein
MHLGRRLSVSSFFGSAALGLLLAGCTGLGPKLAAPGDPLVITDAVEPAPGLTAAQLAARPEPRSAAEVAALEAELEQVAQRRAESADPREIAALEERARELQLLAAAAKAWPLRP